MGEKTGEKVGESLGEIDQLNLCLVISFIAFWWSCIGLGGHSFMEGIGIGIAVHVPKLGKPHVG